MVSKVSQSDFGGGLWRSGARDRVPENASNELQELLLGEDGLAFERGGATRKSNAAVGSTGLVWVADAALIGGQRTVFEGAASGNVRYLNADDVTPASLVTIAASPKPYRPVVARGVMLLGYEGTPYFWAGARKADYSTGTYAYDTAVSPTTVTGTGTSWLANVEAGMFFEPIGGVRQFNVVASVESDTSLTLAWPLRPGSISGLGYALRKYVSGFEITPTATAAAPGVATTIQAAVAGRFVFARRNLVYFSQSDLAKWTDVEDFHPFPSTVVGLATLRDVLLVFTAGGVYAVSNMAYNLESVTGDPQQRVELVNADLIAWGHEGIAPWSGALIVPARDGIWLIDSISSPQKISLAVDDLYLSYVNAGYKPGVAEVFNGHYFLPILNSSNVWQDTLVCRLTQTRSGPPFAWSRLRGADAQVAGYAERSGTPLLLGASLLSSSRVLDCTSYFAPAAGVKADSDSSTRQAVWESREFALSDMPTTVRRVRVWYELTDAAADAPVIGISYAKDSDTSYTEVDNSLGGVQGRGGPSGVASDGTLYHWVPVNKRAHGMRFRVRTFGNNAGFKIRQVELVTEAVQNQ